jgi:hypothetical protein
MLLEPTLDFNNSTLYVPELPAGCFVVRNIRMRPYGGNRRSQLMHEKVMVESKMIDGTLSLLILRPAAPGSEFCTGSVQDRRKKAKVLGPYVNGQSGKERRSKTATSIPCVPVELV